MIRLIMALYNPYDKVAEAPAWTETLKDGATQEEIVNFVSGLVDGFNYLQDGSYEPEPVSVRLIEERVGSEVVILETIMR